MSLGQIKLMVSNVYHFESHANMNYVNVFDDYSWIVVLANNQAGVNIWKPLI